ncbi:formylglycine-generating enzyme family protein [Enterobacter oligotrophicus]
MSIKSGVFTIVLLSLWLFGCDNKEKFIQNSIENMVYVKGGSFDMGDFCPKTTGYACSRRSLPVHKVTLDDFYIARYKVTYRDYDVYTHENSLPELKVNPVLLKHHPELRNPMRPAVANWQLSRDYCQWLGKKSGLPFNLPTEAQWEYAARNRGENVLYATNNGRFDLDVNVPSNETIEKETGISAPYLIGKYPPTPLGLYDMGTDSPEWVYDWYQKDWYKFSPEYNPTGPEKGKKKVVRGIFVGDSREQGSLNSPAVTTSRAGYEPLLKPPVAPFDLIDKYNGDINQAQKEYDKVKFDPYMIAKEGFDPYVSFRCVINTSSLPGKYHLKK